MMRVAFLALALVVVLALVGGVGVVSYKEQDNRFCASCHTEPETMFDDRFVQADAAQTATTLAAFHHYTKQVRCIDCHVGEGALGRATVLTLAAWDALKYVTHTAQQPAHIVFEVQNEACIKCHEADIRKPGFENHYHNLYFDPKVSPPYIACVHCHVSHQIGDERTAFQFRDAILPRCEYCHQQIGRGPRGQATPMP
jgi:nitrate/TMAO reductase-like tetraheme cytochrome c subunit